MADIHASQLFDLKGGVFVVTGGGTGIGAMMAKSFDANGASKVFILGRRPEKLHAVASQAPNKSIIPMVCDVTSQASLGKVAEAIAAQTPYVSTVIANHGAPGPDHLTIPVGKEATVDALRDFWWKIPMAEFNDLFMVNTTSALYTFFAFLPLLEAANKHPDSPARLAGVSSQFVSVSSVAAYARVPIGLGFAYSASKAGLIHMTKQLSAFMAPYHIRANVFAPGLFPSDMSQLVWNGDADVVPVDTIPAGRAGNIEDVAGLMLYMCGKAGSYLNGSVMVSDGGFMNVV